MGRVEQYDTGQDKEGEGFGGVQGLLGAEGRCEGCPAEKK